jgi:Rieske Fe-S protein
MNDAHSQGRDGQPPNCGRRRFCQAAIGGMAAVSAGTVAYPVVTFLKLPKSMTQEESIELPLSDLADGAAVWNEYTGLQIVIIKIDGEPRAFNGACPHLGCVVQWEAQTRTFTCPCHGAIFNDHGEPIAGPVNAPLKKVEFKVQDGVLRIA